MRDVSPSETSPPARSRRERPDGLRWFAKTRHAGNGWLAACLLAFAIGACDYQAETGPHLLDLAGRLVDPLQDVEPPAIVFLFTRSDCPISNRYAPEVNRLYRRFSPQGVIFWLVYPDPAETRDSIEAHLSEYGYGFGALRDPRHALVAKTNARVTPEAAVFVPSELGPQMIYRGRIDDQVVALGQTRSAPAVRDLEQVLEAVVVGQPISPRTSQAIGCFIADLK